MSNNEAIERATKVRRQRRAELIVGEGQDQMVFEVVMPNVVDLLNAGLNPILANISATDEEKQAAIEQQEKELTGDIRKFYPIACKLLESCMVSPRFHNDIHSDAPEGAVTPQDLGNLVFTLANAVMGLLQKEVADVGTATARFRMDTDGQDGAGGMSDVRGEPDRSAESPAG